MPESSAWVILIKRYGESVRQSSDNHLAEAIDEILDENIPSMTEADQPACGW
jgi:hypothetical protein